MVDVLFERTRYERVLMRNCGLAYLGEDDDGVLASVVVDRGGLGSTLTARGGLEPAVSGGNGVDVGRAAL